MLPFKEFIKTKVALPAFAIAGLVLTVLIIKIQPSLTHNELQRAAVAVSYIDLKEELLKPEIIGYGLVQPDLDLQAKAEVTGRVTYMHPQLKKGEIFKKDTLLIKIDDKDYQLQLKQAEADLIASKAKLTEMKINIENNKLDLTISAEKLKVRDKEFARLTKLRKSGSVSQSSLEKERQNLLQQKQEMQQLKNKQTTLPSQLKVVEAQIDISKAKLQKSLRDLERTEIRIPFNGRISQVNTEQDQFVATGASLFNAFGLEKMVINAQFPIDQFRLFINNFRDIEQPISDDVMPNMTRLLHSMGLTARIELAGGGFNDWAAKVERFSDNLDPQTRTVGVVVSVSGSYSQLKPGSKPPLLEGMYMKIMLQGNAVKAVAVPRFSLHENELYLITPDNKLERMFIETPQYQGNLVLIQSTLKAGDKVITSDVFPAVTGMSVTPVLDQAVSDKMTLWINYGLQKKGVQK